MESGKDIAFLLAEHAIACKYEDLPAEAVEVTKKDILDTLGTALAGSTADGINVVRDLVLDWGGKKESSILAHGGKIPSIMAAFVNGTMAHARDFDDIHDTGVVHAGVSAIPASLAIAERKGKVTGRDFVTAIAVGIDLMCRLGMGYGLSPQTSGWHNTAILGIFGSTAICGKLMGFNLDKMINAFGIAYSQCSGNMQCVLDGALSKRMQAGLAAKGAVLSATLAEKGYTGAKNIFEGRYGMSHIYYRAFNREAAMSDLGRRFEVANLSFKPYPCCRGTHTSIDAALALVNEHNIKPAEVEKIVLYHGENASTCLDPLEAKRKPRVVVDAQFSIPYTLARAVFQRKVGLSDFTSASILNEDVIEIAQKVEPSFMPELTAERSCEPVIVEMHLTGNRVYSKRVDYAKGDPQNPMGWEDLMAKFQDCALHSAKPLPKSRVNKVIQLVRKLDEVEDVNQIIQLVT